jgi:hypothetical protein
MWKQEAFLLIWILAADSSTRGLAFSSSFRLEHRRSRLSASINGDFNDVEGRRSFLKSNALFWTALPLSWASGSFPSQASDVRGPVELLRPATRVRLYIDQAIAICRSIQAENSTDISSMEPLAQFFGNEPTSFLTPEETKLSLRYLEIDTSSAWQSARLKEREARGAEIGVDYTTPYDRFNTAIQRWGDKTQFQILRSRQRNLEESNSLRAAFNAYTNNLIFGDAYQLNVQGDAKKNLVRNNALPDVNAVVVSDLDLRDLYRNQILQNVDNAKAELQYQQRTGDMAIVEILDCLVAARVACNDWFGFIPKQDIDAAFESVMSESGNGIL